MTFAAASASTTKPLAVGSSHAATALDLTRSLAAFIVVAEHTRTVFFAPWQFLAGTEKTALAAAFYAVTKLGHIAVLVFFVLSGFLVGGPLMQRILDGSFRPSTYFAARVSRVFTPLVPASAFAVLTGCYLTGAKQDEIVRLILGCFALNDVVLPTSSFDPPLWSVPFEVWFYFLAGSLALLFARRSVGLALAGLLLSTVIFTKLAAVFVLFWLIGAACFHCRAQLNSRLIAAAGLIMFAIGSGIFQTFKPKGQIVNREIMLWAQALACCGIAVVLPWLASSGPNRALVRLRPAATTAAAFSYTLYLFHFPILLLLSKRIEPMSVVSPGSVGTYMAVLFVTIGSSFLLYLPFERQTPHVRAWLTRQFAATRATDPNSRLRG